MTDDTHSALIEAIELRAALDKRDREIATLKGELSKASGRIQQFRKTHLETSISEACKRMGVFEKAIPEIIEYAEKAGDWDIDPKGKFRLKGDDGFFDEDAYEWLRRFKDRSPFYFEDYHLTEGLSGTSGNGSVRDDGAERVAVGGDAYTAEQLRTIFNPDRNIGNFTKSCLIYRENPELARKIAAEVGNKIFDRAEEQDRRFGR